MVHWEYYNLLPPKIHLHFEETTNISYPFILVHCSVCGFYAPGILSVRQCSFINKVVNAIPLNGFMLTLECIYFGELHFPWNDTFRILPAQEVFMDTAVNTTP